MNYRVAGSLAASLRTASHLYFFIIIICVCLVRHTKIATSATKFSGSSCDERGKWHEKWRTDRNRGAMAVGWREYGGA